MNVVPRFTRAALQSAIQERFALLALTDAHVPGAEHRLARIILGIKGQHSFVKGRRFVVLAGLGIHVGDPFQIGAARFAVRDGVEQCLAALPLAC